MFWLELGQILTHLNFTGGCDLPQVGVVGEGDVVGGVPVEAVAVHVEGHRVQHVVDGGDHLRARTRDTFKSNSENQARQTCR